MKPKKTFFKATYERLVPPGGKVGIRGDSEWNVPEPELTFFVCKNKIVGFGALILAIIGTALILIGILKYRDYAIGFSIAGVGFYAIAWAFNALRGRI